MLVRSATADDARAIATIHVETWRVAYAGIVPAAHLSSLSIDEREARWRQSLEAPRSTLPESEKTIDIGGASLPLRQAR